MHSIYYTGIAAGELGLCNAGEATDETLGLGKKGKYQYIKTLRAQLSNHEQTLIYYNSFFGPGRLWREGKKIKERNDDGSYISYFLDYRIIKNVPYYLTTFGPHPEDTFRAKLQERGLQGEKLEKRMRKLFEAIEYREEK